MARVAPRVIEATPPQSREYPESVDVRWGVIILRAQNSKGLQKTAKF
eukprot:CAMPEP_0203964672 /NCGR_PEP_ID=MMETSP0359-20131031/94367_1 /ASSEMBLY_ACC=CAM_ASM_000338 /TAXON_ID=268821 /ORGANISM="Scrippsiella Hangoei, Strain SHTV-5" /LENGTH=46 /DNA_ID= /DNA_START= /DNA_END= /DNA_ORIENTATION=